ncbi:MAG: SDR family NAD(P)-dependent oxidoreductase [Alphaproteobacteria bacterium]|nr:SDR family NAD(P)-dependent oxidoreductase [Alphaproteobacteria bacterium]
MAFGFHSTAEEVADGIDLGGQTWLVTGVSSGLGHETARVLASRGARIIGAARTEAKAQQALDEVGADGMAVACELSEPGQVREAVEKVRASGATLAGIIANAGIMALPTLQQKNGVELQLYTNHVGHFVLVTGLLDRLADDGRVVMLSSGAHFLAKRGLELDNLSGETNYDAWRMYGRSKLANILFARSIARQLEGTGKTANAVHPGVIQTNLARHVSNAEAMFERLRPNMKSVGQGAATQVYVAIHPDNAGVSGEYFADCAVADTLKEAKDDALADALWEATEALL